MPFVGSSVNPSAVQYGVFGYIFGYENGDSSTPAAGMTRQYDTGKGVFYRYFDYCIPQTLRNVTVTGATKIPDYAFNNCAMLETIRFENPSFTTVGTGAFSNLSSGVKIIVPDDKVEQYQTLIPNRTVIGESEA